MKIPGRFGARGRQFLQSFQCVVRKFLDTRESRNCFAISMLCRPISLFLKEQGIFRKEQGIFTTEQGIFCPNREFATFDIAGLGQACRNPDNLGAYPLGTLALRNPITGIAGRCCARAAIGHVVTVATKKRDELPPVIP